MESRKYFKVKKSQLLSDIVLFYLFIIYYGIYKFLFLQFNAKFFIKNWFFTGRMALKKAAFFVIISKIIIFLSDIYGRMLFNKA